MPRPAVEQPRDVVGDGGAQQVRVVGALVAGVEEGALQVRAEQVAIRLHQVGDHATRRGERVEGRRDQRDHGARRAVRAVQGARGADRVGAVVERGAGAAVPVDVDEAGGEHRARSRRLDGVDHDVGGVLASRPRAACRDHAVLEADPAVVDDGAAGRRAGRSG